ncbi:MULTISPECIES: periplasmic heavy metal sensor [Pseudomonadaceae]|jgi:Spy/CpxP family protein refolding chaperone|uniref:Signaling pathway modulator ZraP n=1 Tax=Ectopseudomonas oleovorans TaxID=301 RepID=A0A379JXW6_ECTOL|nr:MULTISPECIES: Spy/CpxP family protein refolding chaperone [Pseudomonas]KFJ91981.1 LTXXQ domain protein [Pseudomonas sp. 1-7]MBP8884675.1 Spy/CpxP family protein refolding chaperone [Pseudomonas sp.]AXO62061.1 LTXXQ domain protein [Pseudomonas sp. phDV1]MBN7116289.1 LTXXQ domain protein [Pseudomonas oleovorans]MBN7134607.1 LTXXQ domain protein [Pseudomonas oleovorans]
MRKTLTALLLAATLPTLAFAMPMHDGGPRHHDRGHSMFKELNLSKEQRQEFRKLMGEQMKTHRDITKRYLDKLPEAEKQAMKKELDKARADQHKALRDLLNPEQQKAFDEHQKKMEARRAEMAEFKAWKAEKDSKTN